jgi:hypothetical protein
MWSRPSVIAEEALVRLHSLLIPSLLGAKEEAGGGDLCVLGLILEGIVLGDTSEIGWTWRDEER